ncbi:MAG: hypothetical protein OEZ33_07345 [Gammaproteobacteria bacterium]|nr:hypothetical protein [Gammaproteobacteria bacterium]
MKIKKYLILFLLISLPCSVFAVDEKYELTHEQWSVPKKADDVLNMPAIAKVFAAIQKYPEGRLLIRYPGGDEGTLWAHELRSWLVSLGISRKTIELRPGSKDAAIIELLVQGQQSGLDKAGSITLNKTSRY